MLSEFPLPDEAIGQAVIVTGGTLAGMTGRIDALPDDPRSYCVLVELDPHGSMVWLDVADLEERRSL